MEYYVIERRSGKGETDISTCFLTDSMEKVREWIDKNKDFDYRNFFWWWAVLKVNMDDELGAEIYTYFDLDGNETETIPINKYDTAEITRKIFDNLLDEKFVFNACLSYRHDFGLLSYDEQESLKFEYREWVRAIKNNYKL
jgi:hypothetical protein